MSGELICIFGYRECRIIFGMLMLKSGSWCWRFVCVSCG